MRGELFQNVLNSIAEAGREILKRRSGANGDAGRNGSEIGQLCRDLLSEKGEALGTALACNVLERYQLLDDDGRFAFFQMLRDEFEPEQKQLKAAIDQYLEQPSKENRQYLEQCVEAPRQGLIRAMNMAPGGTSSLLNMREDLQHFLKQDRSLQVVDADFVHLFSSWFNRGFLRIQEISWNTPANILEKIIEYEAVHAIADWSDLRRRLAGDRRCYGFFHPALPGEPLIFVEVALTNQLSDAIQPLLEDDDIGHADNADTAIFYSISNCQKGLRGIALGNFLIKQVVMELKQDLPNISTFCTLSPVPLFRNWLDQHLENHAHQEEQEVHDTLPIGKLAQRYRELRQRDITSHEALNENDHSLLTRLCGYYLTQVRKNDLPFDPVARFHLGNGARLERINWLGDTSENGIRQSYGVMVNYLYDLSSIEKNHEAYINNHDVIVSKSVSRVTDGR